MRILHTADLHLGRGFNGLSLEEDQAAVLEQILSALIETEAEVLLVAGDLFDRATPPASAVRLFNDFLGAVTQRTDAAVVLIAGNHDSADRVETMAVLTDKSRALIRGVIADQEPPLVLHDTHGPVAFSALPFAYEHAARECFENPELTSPEAVLRAQVEVARQAVPEGARWVIAAHAFVVGAVGSDGERPLTRVGGVEQVSADTFDGAHYVALGHLHRPQQIGAAHIRYSGAPLAFGFDEVGHEKSMTLIDLDAAGAITLREIPFVPIRRLQVLRDSFEALMAHPTSTDFVKICLTDANPVLDAMKRLRERFPNACELTYVRHERAPEVKARGLSAPQRSDPMALLEGFLALLEEDDLKAPAQTLATGILAPDHSSEDPA